MHFVTHDLPGSTKAPELDDANMKHVLKSDERFTGVDMSAGMGVDEVAFGIAVAFLVKVGYLEKRGEIPEIEYQGTYTGGRASAAK